MKIILKMNVGSKIKSLIKEKKLTQLELSRRIGVSAVVMNNYMKKESIDSHTLYNISKALNVPINYFFDEPDQFMKHVSCPEVDPCKMCIEKDKLISAQNMIIKLLSQQLDTQNGIKDGNAPIYAS